MLEGLGEPVREVRELIKDLSFRNGQEKQRGELELLDRRLELAAKYGLLDSVEARTASLSLLGGATAFQLRPDAGRTELPPGDV
jgi:hypothetical protein